MMNLKELEKELDFTNNLLEKLEPYYNREIRELPEELIAELKKIKIGPKITTSGLEKVSNISLALLIAKHNLSEAIENPENYKNRYNNAKQQTTINKPQDTNNLPHNDTDKIQKNTKSTNQNQPPKPVIKPNIETVSPVISPKHAEKIQIKIENPTNSQSPIANSQPPIANTPPIKITIKPEISPQPKPPKQPDIVNSGSSQTPPTASKIDL